MNYFRKSFASLALIAFHAIADAALPTCEDSPVEGRLNDASHWHDCVGDLTSTKTGNRYVGEFKNGKPHGNGTFYVLREGKNKGDRYDGTYRNGKRHGKGIYYFANGNRYEGAFKEGKATTGVMYRRNGVAETGSYINNKWTPQPVIDTAESNNAGHIAMKPSGGTFKVPVRLNNQITLDFTVDSGAADVSVPADVVLTLMRTKTIGSADFRGDQVYVLADGRKVKSKKFVLRSMTVGDKTVTNVEASVADIKGALLLGQSFLKKFESWSINNKTHELILK